MVNSKHKLIFSDSRYLSKEIKKKTIDIVVTSPPYPMIQMWDDLFHNLNNEINKDLIEKNPMKAFDLMHEELYKVYDQCIEVLKDDGIVCINIGDATRNIGLFRLFPNHQKTIDFFLKRGFSQLPSIIWRKPSNSPNKFIGSGMLPTMPYVTLEHEYILIFRKNKREFNKSFEKKNRAESAFFQYERNVWCCDVWNVNGTSQKNTNTARERNAAYPLEIPYRLISLFSVKEDNVLDPFGGTGTTTIAAAALQRNSYLVELSEEFKNDIIKRIKLSKDLINKKNNERIKKAKEISDDSFKYFNKNHNIKVRTSQEKDIKIPIVDKIEELPNTNEVIIKYQQ